MHPVRLYVRQVEPCAREAAGESSRSGRPPSQGDQHLTEWQGFLDVLAGGAPSPRPRREVGGPAGNDSVAASPGTMRQSPTAPHPDGRHCHPRFARAGPDAPDCLFRPAEVFQEVAETIYAALPPCLVEHHRLASIPDQLKEPNAWH